MMPWLRCPKTAVLVPSMDEFARLAASWAGVEPAPAPAPVSLAAVAIRADGADRLVSSNYFEVLRQKTAFGVARAGSAPPPRWS